MRKQSPEQTIKTLALIFMVVAGPVILFGFYQSSIAMKLLTQGVKTTGIVTEQIVSTSNKGGRSYTPVYSFKTQKDKTVTVRSSTGSSLYKKYSKGSAIPVIYLPDSPSLASIYDHTLWLMPLILILSGAIFFTIGFKLKGNITTQSNLEKLRYSGIPIPAKYVNVKAGWKVNRQTSFHIICEALDSSTGQVRQFKSPAIWNGLPQGILPGCIITVYVDQSQPSRYFVDLDTATQKVA